MFICCGVGEVSVHAMRMCAGQWTTSRSEGFSPLPWGLQGSNAGHQICQQVSPLLSHLAIPKHPAFAGQENLETICPQTLLTHSLENPPGVTNDQLSLVSSFKFESGKMHTPY